MSKLIEYVKIEHHHLNPKDFTKEQLKRIYLEGLSQWEIIIKRSAKCNETSWSNAVNQIVLFKNSMPVKYLSPIRSKCEYMAQKSQLTKNEEDKRKASIIIEPSNADYFNMVIPHIPINQSLPLDTIVSLEEETDYTGDKAKRYFLWSSNLTTEKDIKAKIKKIKPDSIVLEPWQPCVHIGSLEIGSKIIGKFKVEESNYKKQNSYQLYLFTRDSDDKEFTISMYYYYNILPKDLINMLLKMCKNEIEYNEKIVKGEIQIASSSYKPPEKMAEYKIVQLKDCETFCKELLNMID